MECQCMSVTVQQCFIQIIAMTTYVTTGKHYKSINTRCQNLQLTIYLHTTTTTLHPFNGLFSRTTWVSQYQKGKTSLYLNEARAVGSCKCRIFGLVVQLLFWANKWWWRDYRVLGCTGISGTICKQYHAPHSRQITTQSPHHCIFTGQMLFLAPNEQCQCSEGSL